MSIVIFDVANTVRAVRHKLIGLKRRLTGQKGNTYVQLYLSDPTCATEFKPRESSLTCHICGFQMVEMVSPEDWTIELCPAEWKNCIADAKFLKKWLADLGRVSSYNRTGDKTADKTALAEKTANTTAV
jgi:hypothetical protein